MKRMFRKPLWLGVMLLAGCPLLAQETLSPAELKKLSVEELMNLEVTLVSRTPQRLAEAASAIQVITQEDIRRSGATSLPEALRLASNMQVAQYHSSAWIISARGFNTIFANKLLVMIDGRTVYTPLFGGVIWELQNLMLEDVDRIEIISGPGGTLWGANAVNGVINIITRSAAATQGAYLSVAGGNFLKHAFEARYGGRLGKDAHYRVYGMHFSRKPTYLPDGNKNKDDWKLSQAGFRIDWNAGLKDSLTFQGDLYGGERNTGAGYSDMNGQNFLSRWTHRFSPSSDLSFQAYFDRYFRDDKSSGSSDALYTIDFDLQHSFALGKVHRLVWGASYRFVKDHAIFSTDVVAILPPEKRLDQAEGFLQDEISLGSRMKLTVGTKVLHNAYTDLEWQPSGRLAYTVDRSTIWAAVSRAVRTPSRYDVDYFLPAYPVPPSEPSVAGGPNFVTEKLLAYEAGYRLQPTGLSNFSVAAFYNVYRDVYSVEALPGTQTYQIQNGSEGETWGAEFSGNYQPASNWRLRGGYTFMQKDLRAKKGRNFDPQYLANDVRHHAVLQSILNLPFNMELDITGRYMSDLPKTLATPGVPAYFNADARLAWVLPHMELSVVGQNLLHRRQAEFSSFLVPRSFYIKLVGRF